MQSCHIAVAVRLKTRMTGLRKQRSATRGGFAYADGRAASTYNETGQIVCMIFHNREDK